MSLLYRMGTGNGSGGDLKPYIVQFTCDSGYIGQTLTMTYKGTPHAGETVDNVSGTVVLDSTDGKGKLTLYPMHSGNWECSCYSSVIGTTMKKTIELSYWGTTNVEFNDIPDGATVTPTDDVQTWLHCANIWDKTDLTTIDDVIADTTTLNILVSDNNASDYLARSTTWASDICSNESAMTYIGLNDYCANKLLSDSTWLETICNAEENLLKKVLTIFVPRLRDNTNVEYQSIRHDAPPWKAFDEDDSTYGQGSSGSTSSGAYLGYNFNTNCCVKCVRCKNANGATNTMALEGYDGSNWNPIGDFNITTNDGMVVKVFNHSKSYTKYRLYQKSATSSNNMQFNTIQFYGREA